MYPTVVSATLRLLSNTYPPYPPFFLSAPPEGDRPSIHYGLLVYLGYVVSLGKGLLKGEPPSFPPSEPLFPHPWSTTSTGNSRHPFSGAVIPRGFEELDPSKNGAFFLGDGLRKIASCHE